MLNDRELHDLQNETRRRQRRITDLQMFDGEIAKMMEFNVSLPVILQWLKENHKVTTLPALRRYIRRVFGDDWYLDFVKRNGWSKSRKQLSDSVEQQSRKGSSSHVGKVSTSEAGFHKIIKEIEEKKSNGDPRRNK